MPRHPSAAALGWPGEAPPFDFAPRSPPSRRTDRAPAPRRRLQASRATRTRSSRCRRSSRPSRRRDDVNRYPDATAAALREPSPSGSASRIDEVHVGAGSVVVLAQFIQAAAGPGDEVVYAWRSFEAYPGLVTVAGATSVQVPNRRRRAATTSTRWPRRSPIARASSSSAPRTTRRAPRSPPSSRPSCHDRRPGVPARRQGVVGRRHRFGYSVGAFETSAGDVNLMDNTVSTDA